MDPPRYDLDAWSHRSIGRSLEYSELSEQLCQVAQVSIKSCHPSVSTLYCDVVLHPAFLPDDDKRRMHKITVIYTISHACPMPGVTPRSSSVFQFQWKEKYDPLEFIAQSFNTILCGTNLVSFIWKKRTELGKIFQKIYWFFYPEWIHHAWFYWRPRI